MKVLLFAAVAIMVVCSSSFSQPVIVIDTLEGGLCGEPQVGYQSTLTVSIHNPDSVLYELAFAIRLTPPDENLVVVPQEIEFLNGFPDYFVPEGWASRFRCGFVNDGYDGVFYFSTYFWPPEIFWDGMPAANDTVPVLTLTMKFQDFGGCGPDGANVCVEHTTCDSVPEWNALPGPAPSLAEAKCFHVDGPMVNCRPWIDGGENIIVMNCGMLSSNYTVSSCNPCEIAYLEIVSGSEASVIRTGTHSFLLEYVPRNEDAGQTVHFVLQGGCDECGDGSYMINGDFFDVFVIVAEDYVTDDPVQFNAQQSRNFVATTGDTLRMTPIVDDDGPCTDYTYSWHVFEPEPTPNNFWIEEETGTFCYLGETQDTGKYWVYGVVKERDVADTMLMIINHFESFTPGDCDHSGNVDMGDLTWLISTLFIDYISPIPPQAGEMDCSPGVSLGDMTLLVDHLFISYEPLPVCP